MATSFWLRHKIPFRFLLAVFLLACFAYTYLLLLSERATILSNHGQPFSEFPAYYPWRAKQPASDCPIPDDPELSDADVVAYRKQPSHLEKLFPEPDPWRKDYNEWNARTQRELISCIALNNCGPNQTKIAILSAHWIEEGVVRSGSGGESIWGISIYNSLRTLGYTTIFAPEWDEILAYHRLFPDMVKVILRDQTGECHLDPHCVKGQDNPAGIPAWKLFDFEYFPQPGRNYRNAGQLGGKWILSASKDVENQENPDYIQYIGYSIEDQCNETPYIPLANRPNRAYILTKELVYLYLDTFVWEVDYFKRAVRDAGINFVGSWQMTPNWKWEHVPPEQILDIVDEENGISKVGPGLNKQSFAVEVGKSRMMVGIGLPLWSPSPFVGLCQGVPFLNPIHEWDSGNPWDRMKWKTQHPELNVYDPPYVYHVHAKNYTGFVDALRKASTTEIPRFIPDYMTEQALQKRLILLMETDWKAKAAEVLEENLRKQEAGENAFIFQL